MKIKQIALYAILAAVYVALSLVMGPLSFMPVQVRIAEVLLVLCIFDKRYIVPMTLACFVTNLVSLMLGFNYFAIDVIVGTIATFISCVLMYLLRNRLFKGKPILSLLMPAIVNGLIIGVELTLFMYPLGSFVKYAFINIGLVFVGEFVSVFVLGLLMYKNLARVSNYINTLE